MTPPNLDAAITAPSRQDMIDDLRHLIEVESPSSDLDACRRAGDAVAEVIERRLGVAPTPYEVDGHRHLLWTFDSMAANTNTSTSTSTNIDTLLIGHFDTVFPIGTLAERPFNVDDAGRATGPGVYDMKGGIVQMIHAVAALDPAQRAGVAIFLNDDEEIGSVTSRPIIEELGRQAKAAMVFEGAAGGAEGILKTGRRGTSNYYITVHGLAAHAGLNPHEGVNALVELAHVTLAATKVCDLNSPGSATPTVGTSGGATNVVPDEAKLTIDVRAETVEEQLRIDAAIKALQPTLPGAELQIEGGINRPPMPETASEKLFTIAEQAAQGADLAPVSGVAVGGGSDANFVAPLGVPVLDGLGAVGGGAHQKDEWCDTNQMPVRSVLVAEMLRRMSTT